MLSGADSRASSNLLKDLRKFRFQKKTSNSATDNSSDNEMNSSSVISSAECHRISDSDPESSCGSSSNKSADVIVIDNDEPEKVHCISDSEEEEEKPKVATKAKPLTISSDSEIEEPEPPKKYSRIKSFDSFKFKKENGNISNNSRPKSPVQNSVPVKRKAKQINGKAKKRRKSDSETEDEDMAAFKQEVVYDSDEDSDVEISNKMNKSQMKVFEFLNTATSVELLQVPTCTQNKVNAIIEGRPFSGWRDMVMKFKNGKNLGAQVLNHTLDVLKTRSIVSKLMNKCLNIAVQTEKCISEGSTMLKEQPSMITPELRLKGYQIVGLNWLAVMHSQNLSGILADEMGLGKTVQVISFLAYLKENGMVHSPHLVIAPSTTLENWAIEFARCCPEIRVVIYHGNPDERRALRYLWFKQKFKEFDVIITTYNMVSSSYEEKKMFKIVQMQYVIFDEAHMLKNMNTQRYFNLFNIKAEHRILLTGTPLQNNLLELMSLLNFVMPNMFARKIDFIKTYFSKNSKLPLENLPAFEQEQVEQAKRIMKPFVLRRLKQDVLKDLPEKTSEVLNCPMSEHQQMRYEQLSKDLMKLAEHSPDDYNYMSSFMQLRKLANHPLTMLYNYKGDQLKEIAKLLANDSSYKGSNEEYVLEDLYYMSDLEIHKLATQYPCLARYKLSDELFLDSGKFNKLDEILPKLKSEGHRVIIFSQFVFVLDLLEEYLNIRGHSSVRLDGSTRSLDRQDLIDNYNEDSSIFIFLLTTRAGGVGINLATADTVIIHDVDFNPYNDKQAEDRCHRLGQTKPVHVIRMISEGTVEVGIYAKAQDKLNLEQELTGVGAVDDSEENKNVELLLKEILGLAK